MQITFVREGGGLGLVVMGEVSPLGDCEFVSQQWILVR